MANKSGSSRMINRKGNSRCVGKGDKLIMSSVYGDNKYTKTFTGKPSSVNNSKSK